MGRAATPKSPPSGKKTSELCADLCPNKGVVRRLIKYPGPGDHWSMTVGLRSSRGVAATPPRRRRDHPAASTQPPHGVGATTPRHRRARTAASTRPHHGVDATAPAASTRPRRGVDAASTLPEKFDFGTVGHAADAPTPSVPILLQRFSLTLATQPQPTSRPLLFSKRHTGSSSQSWRRRSAATTCGGPGSGADARWVSLVHSFRQSRPVAGESRRRRGVHERGFVAAPRGPSNGVPSDAVK